VRREFFGVTDAFAVLGLSRRPWVDAEEIQSRHRELAVQSGRDGAGMPLSHLNEARRIMEGHGSRLRHLAALEFPDADAGGKYEPDWKLFESVGTLSRLAGLWAGRLGGAGSAIARAALMSEACQLRERLREVRVPIEEMSSRLDESVRSLDRRWPDVTPAELFSVAEEWTYWQRWEARTREVAALLDGA